eukprot:3080670-Amphidinium_carterae.1
MSNPMWRSHDSGSYCGPKCARKSLPKLYHITPNEARYSQSKHLNYQTGKLEAALLQCTQMQVLNL